MKRISQSSVNLHRYGTPEFNRDSSLDEDYLSKSFHSGMHIISQPGSFERKAYEAEDISTKRSLGAPSWLRMMKACPLSRDPVEKETAPEFPLRVFSPDGRLENLLQVRCLRLSGVCSD